MFKIKLNWKYKDNVRTFKTFLLYNKYFRDIGVEFIDEGEDYDLIFIGGAEFFDRDLPFQESIELGLQYLSTIDGDYFLFDGSDSTSLMGSYEALEKSNAKYLFKPSITTQERYKKAAPFNKWFWSGVFCNREEVSSGLNLSYDIPDYLYKKIKLTGWHWGYHNPNYRNVMGSYSDRPIDVCAMYSGYHSNSSDHGIKNDHYYTLHRGSSLQALRALTNISCETGWNSRKYVEVLRKSKAALSPFGMGELCVRDFEIIQEGSLLIKPSMDLVLTRPNIYIPYETYIPCKLDWSDLAEKIEWIKDNKGTCRDIANNAQELLSKECTLENLLIYWQNIIFPKNRAIDFDKQSLRSHYDSSLERWGAGQPYRIPTQDQWHIDNRMTII